MKQRATAEADAALQSTSSELATQGEQAASTAAADVDALAKTLAARVLGVDSATLSDTRSTSGAVN